MSKQIYDNDKFKGARLPDFLVPHHYELKLKPDLEKYTFEGTVEILFSLRESVNDPIVLNSSELIIHEGYLQNNSTRDPLTTVTYSKDSGAVTLEFGASYPKKGTIFLKFTGTLNDTLRGFYRSSFHLDGKQEVVANTQFAPCDARLCFPCWDEPAKKATFKLTLQYEDAPSRDAISNMPVISDTVTNGMREKVFDVSPVMSTYLLAFAVGPFEYLEVFDEMKRPIRVYTLLGNKEKGQFAAELACKSLRYFEKYFGIEYPLPKLDLIAVPEMSFGAMENWGLITYRESKVLVDIANTSTATKQSVAITVAHELAHQWFGNLVTMDWWTDLWLNEGFATFVSFLCINDIFPDYDIWSQFVTSSYTRGMALDALHNSHPIEVPVEKISEINEIFDAISYNKGASALRMLYNYIGDDHFRKGMKHYLTKFSYKNATTANLWESLEAASGKPINRLMSGWTSQKGFPWISVLVSKIGADVELTLRQEKFSADGQLKVDDTDSIWLVPIQVVVGSNPEEVIDLGLLGEKQGVFRVEGAGDNWIKLNPGTIGLYRTAYPADMIEKLKPAISTKSLSSVDRLGLLNDYFALSQAGKAKTLDLFYLLMAYQNETDYVVWSSIDSCVDCLNVLLTETDFEVLFQKFTRELYKKIYQTIAWSPSEKEKHTDAMTRALVIERLVSLRRSDVVDESLKRYKAFRKGETFPADVRGAMYKAASKYGHLGGLFNLYLESDLSEERNRIARAIGSANDYDVCRVIEFTLSGCVKNQDKILFIAAIGLANPEEAWKLLKVHKDVLLDIYGKTHLISNIVKYCTENFAYEEKAQEIFNFFEDNKFPGAERAIQQSLETIRLNTNWLRRDYREMLRYKGVLIPPLLNY